MFYGRVIRLILVTVAFQLVANHLTLDGNHEEGEEDEEGEKVATAKDIDMKLMADEEIPDEVEESGNDSESEDGSRASEEEGEPKIDPKQEQYERDISKSIKK